MNQMYELQEINNKLKAENEYLQVLMKGYQAMYQQAKKELEAMRQEGKR